MSDAGLDASKHAFWCSVIGGKMTKHTPMMTVQSRPGDTYDTADEAPEGATQRLRHWVRYPELLAFIGAATEQRLADLETRVTALEDA